MAATQEKKVPRSLTNMFKRKDREEPGAHPYPDLNNKPSTATQNTSDSAYASSEPPSSTSEQNFVPVENNGQIQNVSSDRNLEMNQSTGDVMDKDTGEVVSTVTTTTTTTTTTMTKRGANGEKTSVEVSTQPGGSAAGAGAGARDRTPDIHEAPGDSAHTSSHARQDSGNAFRPDAAGAQQPQHHQPQQQQRAPVIPARSPHRKSQEYIDQGGASPGYNFSHPSRSNLRNSGEYFQQQHQHPHPSNRSTFDSLRSAASGQGGGGTLDNLKAAAVGLHGVGETLRGTFNSGIDQRFPRSNPDSSGAANAKNQGVLDRGRDEMQRISENRESWDSRGAHAPPIPPKEPVTSVHPAMRDDHIVSPMPQQQRQPPPWEHQQHQEAPWQDNVAYVPPGLSNEATNGGGPVSENRGSTPEKKGGGIRKLVKRRHG